MIASVRNKPLPPTFFLHIAYLYQVLSDAIYIIIMKILALLVRNQNLIDITSTNIDFKLGKCYQWLEWYIKWRVCFH